MNKKVSFGAKPSASPRPDDWVNGSASIGEADEGGGAAVSAAEPRGVTKRLTFDVSLDLHTRIKVQCALKGSKVADELRVLLEEHFPATTERDTASP